MFRFTSCDGETMKVIVNMFRFTSCDGETMKVIVNMFRFTSCDGETMKELVRRIMRKYMCPFLVILGINIVICVLYMQKHVHVVDFLGGQIRPNTVNIQSLTESSTESSEVSLLVTRRSGFQEEDKQYSSQFQTTENLKLPLDSVSKISKTLENPNFTKIEDFARNKVTQINAHPYTFLINPVGLCSQTKTPFDLLVLISSGITNYEQRSAIRSTWGSEATVFNNSGNVRLAFLLGYTTDQTIQDKVFQEAQIHSDIVQENFLDTYRNLTLKSVMLLKWVSEFCHNVHFVMKTDDDMYINIQNLLKMVSKLLNRSNIMIGYLFSKATPDRKKENKWYVPKSEFPGGVYPNYLSGTGYVMTHDVIPKLYQTCLNTKFLAMEDIFVTGIVASKAKVARIHNSQFSFLRRNPSGCAFVNAISGHHVTVKEMKKIWEELKQSSLRCKSQ
ncbi:beta-1,3-galactosyltransferase 1-like isoform X2 [Limulus polyphemus]|uniref:Hexosyltransferase n=1 Tax=Limulus polyphemus TaxID=6850 RepID=A0ABM1RV44_LIMPO|nr:beta-1,3-galactosyltransferase 1-like isoform X2 [Limulus polyphemus]